MNGASASGVEAGAKTYTGGVRWILNNELREDPVCGVRGGFIADEMGLGKTIQMLGTIITNVKRHTLIVLPKALLDQWKNAIIKTFIIE